MSTKLLVCSRLAGFTQFDLAAFLPNTDLPNGIVGPPILPVGSLLVGPPIRLSGPVVAFDDPIVVGTYDITLAAVAVPSSAMLLFSGLLGLIGLGRLRRRSLRPGSRPPERRIRPRARCRDLRYNP